MAIISKTDRKIVRAARALNMTPQTLERDAKGLWFASALLAAITYFSATVFSDIMLVPFEREMEEARAAGADTILMEEKHATRQEGVHALTFMFGLMTAGAGLAGGAYHYTGRRMRRAQETMQALRMG